MLDVLENRNIQGELVAIILETQKTGILEGNRHFRIREFSLGSNSERRKWEIQVIIFIIVSTFVFVGNSASRNTMRSHGKYSGIFW